MSCSATSILPADRLPAVIGSAIGRHRGKAPMKGNARQARFRQRHAALPSAPEPAGRDPGTGCEVSRVLNRKFVDGGRKRRRGDRVATLLDERKYLCLIRTMYRIFDANKEVRERRDQIRHPPHAKPQLVATAPNQVLSWGITKLFGPMKWTHYNVSVVIDICSRYVVGWMLAHRECQHLAGRLLPESAIKKQIRPERLPIHADRGPAMTSRSVSQLMGSPGISQSHSR